MRRNEYIISLLTIIAKTDTSEIPYNYLVDSAEHNTINLNEDELLMLLENAEDVRACFQQELLKLMLDGHLTDSNLCVARIVYKCLEECDFEMAFNYLGYDPQMVCEGYGISSLDELTNKEIAKDIREILEELA